MSLPRAEILKYVERLEKEAKDIKKDILKICWYMRGMNYSDAIMLSYDERMIVADIIHDNLETTKIWSTVLLTWSKETKTFCYHVSFSNH